MPGSGLAIQHYQTMEDVWIEKPDPARVPAHAIVRTRRAMPNLRVAEALSSIVALGDG
jgi:predicted SAM-dependent methyltransferase